MSVSCWRVDKLWIVLYLRWTFLPFSLLFINYGKWIFQRQLFLHHDISVQWDFGYDQPLIQRDPFIFYKPGHVLKATNTPCLWIMVHTFEYFSHAKIINFSGFNDIYCRRMHLFRWEHFITFDHLCNMQTSGMNRVLGWIIKDGNIRESIFSLLSVEEAATLPASNRLGCGGFCCQLVASSKLTIFLCFYIISLSNQSFKRHNYDIHCFLLFAQINAAIALQLITLTVAKYRNNILFHYKFDRRNVALKRWYM